MFRQDGNSEILQERNSFENDDTKTNNSNQISSIRKNSKAYKSNGNNTNNDRCRGHLRGTRSNGFASGPPFPNSKQTNSGDNGASTRFYWATTPAERQKQQQQIELIEKEINVMAQESQCGIGKWR